MPDIWSQKKLLILEWYEIKIYLQFY